MAIQYSIQKMVSDGTLSTIALGIQYLQRNDIYMRIAGEETPQSGAPSGYTWSFLDASTIRVLPVVPTGITVEVYRRTDITGMYNVFSQNAQFDEGTIDENNTQLLYIAQEYLEQDLTGVGIASLEYVRSEPGYEIYIFQRQDGTYFPEFPVPTDMAALETHKVSTDQHTILGVAGLSSALSALTAADTSLSTSINNVASELSDLTAADTALSTSINNVASDLALTKLRVDTLELCKSTCLVNAVGTGAPHETVVTQLPADIAVNSRYVLPNPFGVNTPVECWAELLINGVWADAGWGRESSNAYGTRASYVQGQGVVVQSGKIGVVAESRLCGGGHGLNTSYYITAPCRVFVRKLEA